MIVHPPVAVTAFLIAGGLAFWAGPINAQSREQLREQFRDECRAQYPHLAGPAHKEERYAKVSACVKAKFATQIRGDALRAAATPVSAGVEQKLVETDAWLIGQKRGPEEAKGVIYFVRGYPLPSGLDAFRTLPHFARTLAENGWDIIAAKVPTGVHTRGMENVAAGAAFMRRRTAELKAKGYKRVVLGGHSWGGWAALLAAQTSDFGADALLLSAPATYGGVVARLGSGINPIFNMNLTEFPRAVSKVRTPTVLILPTDPEGFDPDAGKRGAIAVKHFEQEKVAHLVIAKPPGFSGHFAAWLPVFDYAYGRCIDDFIGNPATLVCTPRPLTNDDFRSIVSLDQVAGVAEKVIASADPLVGRKFVAYTLSPKVTHHYDYVSAGQRQHMEGSRLVSEAVAFRQDLHCVGSQCSKLIKWSNRELLEFDPKGGKLVGWWVEQR